MTITGPDISSFERGVSIRALPDAAFVLAKTTEGTYYADAYYDGWRREAASVGKPFVWYHFLSGEDVHKQVAYTLAHVGDRSLPGMLDVEPTKTYTPTLRHALDYIDVALAVGLRLRFAYLPRWFWSQIGAPDLTSLTDRGLGLISSAYPGGSGYPGDGASGWRPYGGVTPLLYQYTDAATLDGQFVGDMNAYRGTVQQLAAFLGTASGPSPAPAPSPSPSTPSGPDVNLSDQLGPISPGMAALTPDAVAEGLGSGSTFTVGAALAGMTVRQAETLILVKRLCAAIGNGTDVAAIASAVVAAMVPHLPAAVDGQVIAAAVVAAVESHAPGVVDLDGLASLITQHFGAALAKG